LLFIVRVFAGKGSRHVASNEAKHG